MGRQSCIQHVPGTYFVAIRQDYVGICKGAPDANCSAAILNSFENWTNSRIGNVSQAVAENERRRREGLSDDIPDDLWIYRTQEQIKDDDLQGIWGIAKVRNCLLWLAEQGFIWERKNPKYKWDHTKQYHLDVDRVNDALRNWQAENSDVKPWFFKNEETGAQNRGNYTTDSRTEPQTETDKDSMSGKPDAPADPSLAWDAFTSDVTAAFGCRAEVNHVANMLLGRSKKKPYSEYNFDVGLTPIQMHKAVVLFPAWYAQQYDGLTPPRKPTAIVDIMHEFLDDGREWRQAYGDGVLKASGFFDAYPTLAPPTTGDSGVPEKYAHLDTTPKLRDTDILSELIDEAARLSYEKVSYVR